MLYRFNEKNQLVAEEGSDGKNQFTYDRQGGIVEEKNSTGIRLFSYNSRHQQIKAETENGDVQENHYDAEILRFELLENGKKTSFVYHYGELLHEEAREEQKVSYHLGLGIDALQRGQELSYFHKDEQLSTAFISGRQGEIRNSYQYDLQRVYAETRPNVDMDIVESKLQEEYDMAMGMREVRESLELEGENDMSELEKMKDEEC